MAVRLDECVRGRGQASRWMRGPLQAPVTLLDEPPRRKLDLSFRPMIALAHSTQKKTLSENTVAIEFTSRALSLVPKTSFTLRVTSFPPTMLYTRGERVRRL